MKPYVVPINNEHLNFLQLTETANDPLFEIPSITLKSSKDKKTLNLSRNSMTGTPTIKKQNAIIPNPENIDCGELTSRIFSALVQEKIIPETKKKLKYRFKKSELFQDYPISFTDKSMETVEERIRNELSEIGLIDINLFTQSSSISNGNNLISSSSTINQIATPITPVNNCNDSQDDEILSELKELQQKLMNQININNQNKKDLLTLATLHIKKEQQRESINKEKAGVEKLFLAAFPKIKKKKK